MPGQSIIVTNHDMVYIELIVAALQQAGYQKVVALPNVDAYHAIRVTPPDLIVLDIATTSANEGWRMLDLLRLDPLLRPIPVLFCVQRYLTFAHNMGALQALNCYVLLKPFDQPMLLSLVRSILGPPDSSHIPAQAHCLTPE